MTHSIVFNCRT